MRISILSIFQGTMLKLYWLWFNFFSLSIPEGICGSIDPKGIDVYVLWLKITQRKAFRYVTFCSFEFQTNWSNLPRTPSLRCIFVLRARRINTAFSVVTLVFCVSPTMSVRQFCGSRPSSAVGESLQTPWMWVVWQRSATASRRDTSWTWWKVCSQTGGSGSRLKSRWSPWSLSQL